METTEAQKNGAQAAGGSRGFALPSGARLDVTVSEFQKAGALTKAVLRHAKLAPEDLKLDLAKIKEGAVGLLAGNPGVFADFLNRLVGMATSDELEAAAMECAKRATWTPAGEEGQLRVLPSLFDDPKWGMAAREDYYAILARVMEVNCGPFFARTFSALLAASAPSSASQK